LDHHLYSDFIWSGDTEVKIVMNLIASNKSIVVLGLGVTGLSVVRYLRRKNQYFTVMDSRKNPPGLDVFQREFKDVRICLGEFDQSILNNSTQIIISPGIDLKIPEVAAAIAAGIEVMGDVELFARELLEQNSQKPLIAITGTNGKTTVTTLVGQMAKDSGLKVAIGGNIGKPVLDLLEEDFDIYVLELSSFQLETTQSLKPKVASILNITLDHMDRYDSLMEYHRVKQRVYFGAENIVANRADPLTQPPLAKGVSLYSFGIDQPDRNGFGTRVDNGQAIIVHEFSKLLPVNQLKIRGQHNIANAIAAMAIGYVANFPIQSMLSTLKSFHGLPHRCQWIANINGINFFNDSKATNVGATIAALSGFGSNKKNIILITGGESKGADFSPLKPVIHRFVSSLILIGCDANLIVDAIDNDEKVEFAKTLKESVAIAKSHAIKGDIVLFSPACASFDMFINYEDRGNQFIDAVKGIAA
jgi:UDP-N-acetylmuramoylalanine--D-glutamate ligase